MINEQDLQLASRLIEKGEYLGASLGRDLVSEIRKLSKENQRLIKDNSDVRKEITIIHRQLKGKVDELVDQNGKLFEQLLFTTNDYKQEIKRKLYLINCLVNDGYSLADLIDDSLDEKLKDK